MDGRREGDLEVLEGDEIRSEGRVMEGVEPAPRRTPVVVVAEAPQDAFDVPAARSSIAFQIDHNIMLTIPE